MTKGLPVLQTDLGPLEVVRAGAQDVDRAYELTRHIAEWVQSLGYTQPDWLFTERGRTHIQKTIEERELYLVLKDNVVVASVWLRWDDEDSWGAKGSDGRAGYVHGFGVHRAWAGHGIGRALLEWVAGLVASRGKDFVRLECDARSERLCDYYRRAGFTDAGLVGDEGFMLRRFEKPADHRPIVNRQTPAN